MKSIKKLFVGSGIVGLIGIGSYIHIQKENNSLYDNYSSIIVSPISIIETADMIFNIDGANKMASTIIMQDVPIIETVTTPPSSTTPMPEEVIECNDNKQLVSLTFDDGPCKYTEDLLGLLEKYDIRATFFVLEYNCRKYPEMLLKMAENGHEIAIHGSTHTSFTDLTVTEVDNEILSTINYIESLDINASELVRPPYGSLNSSIKENVDYPFILWNIDTEDWKSRDKELIKQEIIDNISGGSIILMHDTNRVHECNYEALDELIPTLIDDYSFVTVTELFEKNNLEPENGKVYGKVKSEN